MVKYKLYVPVAVAVFLGIILQVILILADCTPTPGRAAVEFAKAFYRIDPAMSSLLCSKNLEMDEGSVVEKYIQSVTQEARDRGFGLNNMKYMLYHIETHTRRIDDTTAEVKLTATRKVSINPIYALVAKFFLIGETYKVDELILVVKEDGLWKVCDGLFPSSEI
ncbi:MAG: hypothetical protein P1P89_08545 [Desulfobacterales bacterium]|nr:hypothetical protein [Desulfobacterales bacterium]